MINLNKGIGVVGSTTIDKIFTGYQSYLKLGGVTTYAGITYRRHGIPVHIVSNQVSFRMARSSIAASKPVGVILHPG